MIRFNSTYYPEHEVERICDAQIDCGGRKRWGYRLTTRDGRQSESMSAPEHMTVVPNHSNVEALVVTVYPDGGVHQDRYPVVAWRVDALAEERGCAEPVLPITRVSNQAVCLVRGATAFDFDMCACPVDEAVARMADAIKADMKRDEQRRTVEVAA